MKNSFNKRQRFSLRKYSFGVASVLLGVSFFSATQTAQADELESSDAGLLTIAEPDISVEVTEPTIQTQNELGDGVTSSVTDETMISQSQAVVSSDSLSEVVSTSSDKATLSEASVASTAMATSEQATSQNSESPQIQESGSQSVAEQDVSVATSMSDDNVIDRATASEIGSHDAVIDSTVATNTDYITVPLRELSHFAAEQGMTHLLNAINAAVAETNRGHRGQSGTVGLRSVTFDNTTDLSAKLAAVQSASGLFVDKSFVENLKVAVVNGNVWVYNYKISGMFWDRTKNSYSPNTHYVATILYRDLGYIDYVNSNGDSIPGVTAKATFNNATDNIVINGFPYDDAYDAGITKIPTIPAGYRLKTVNGDPTKVEAYVDILETASKYSYTDVDAGSEQFTSNSEAENKYPATKLSDDVWRDKQRETVTLIRQADGSYALDPSISANDNKSLAPAYRYHLILEEDTKDITQPTSLTVTYTGAATNPAADVQNNFTFTGKENNQTGVQTWDSTTHAYGTVASPVVSGYYADKATAGGLTVTPTAPNVTDTVTYKTLGQIIYVDEVGNQIPNTTPVTYNNDMTDPTKAAETALPDLPSGYELKSGQSFSIIQMRDGSRILLPTNPGSDSRIVLVSSQAVISQASRQTVTFTGAGSDTPSDKVQDDFTFSGTQDQVTGAKTWNQTNHTYGTEVVPVVRGYYADKATAGGLTVTPDTPTVTDTVAYQKLGQIILVDGQGNQIAGTQSVVYSNDTTDPTKVVATAIPTLPAGYEIQSSQAIPGYNVSTNTVLPPNLGVDTLIVLIAKVGSITQSTSQTVSFTGAGTKTPATDVKDDYRFTGTENQVTGAKTWDATSHTYDTVVVPVVNGYYADKANAGGLTVTPDAPTVSDTVTYKVIGKIIPVDENGTPITGANQPQYTNDPSDPTKVIVTNVPGITGYTPRETSVTPTDPGVDTPVVYVVNRDAVSKATSQTVTFTGAGTATPASDVKDNYSFSGTYNQVDKTTTWAETNHTYGIVSVPVLTGYYADKATAGGLTVTPDAPTVSDTVTYKVIGKIIPVDENGTPITGANQPQYTNDPSDPTKVIVTNVPGITGYTPRETSVTPTDPGVDTTVVYVKDDQKAFVLYLNEDGNTEIARAELIGKSGEAITYTTSDQINRLKRQGYELVSDDFTSATDKTFDNDKSVDQTFTVILRERIETVDPKQPRPTANTSVDPNDPNTPSWPSSVAGLDNMDTVTRTVRFVYANGQTAAQDVAETLTFQRLARVNLVTGAISYEPWTTAKDSFDVVEVPAIAGYTPDHAGVDRVTGVTAGTADSTVVVTYHQDDQKATVTYLDETTDTQLVQDILSGKSGDLMTYSTKERVQYYLDRGYELVSVDFPDVARFDYDATVDQGFTVRFIHATAPVGPNDPHEPGTPINPQDPDGPKWPVKDTYSKTVTATVHYQSTDGKASVPADKVQTANWTRTLILDKVTGQIISSTDWSADKTQYDAVGTPVLTGYFADKGQVVAKAVLETNLDEVVTYSPLGHIIPVDGDGNPIVDVDQPQYNNDPNDPTKASLTAVPQIAGYHTETTAVTPDNPGQDTKVVYVKDAPPAEEKGYIVLVYRDENGNQIRMPQVITSSIGADYDLGEGDPYIYRNGVKYELIRTEGKTKGKVGKGRTTVTYTYRKVEDPSPTQPDTPQSPVSREQGQTPVIPSSETKEQADPQAETQSAQLPETGDGESGQGLGVMALLAGLGLGVTGYRRKKKD